MSYTPTSVLRRQLIYLTATAAVTILYILTTAPSVYTNDSAEFTLGVYTQGIVHSTGYPTYLLLGRVFTWLPLHPEFAVRVNLFSAVAGVVTFYCLLRLCEAVVGYDPLLTAGVCGVFVFAPEIWAHAVVAEVYLLHTALVSAILLLTFAGELSVGRLYVIALLFGVSFGNHLAAVLVAAVVYPYLWWQAPTWRVRWTMVAMTTVVTVTLYLYLPVRFAADPALNILEPHFDRDLRNPANLLWLVSGGMFDERMFGYGPVAYLRELVAFVPQLGRNLTLPGVLVGLVGVWDLARRFTGGAVVVGGAFTLQVIFFAGYNVFDKWTMFHTAYLMWTVFMVAGVFRLMALVPRQWLVGVLAVICVYQVAAHWQSAGRFRDTGVRDQSLAILEALPPDALLVGSWLSVRPVDYFQQVHGLRPDVTLYDFTLVGLSMRDALPDETEGAWQAATLAATAATIDCYPGDVFIVEGFFIEDDYALEPFIPGLFRVTKQSLDCR